MLFRSHPGEIQKNDIHELRVLLERMGVSLVILLAYLRQDSKITREDKERVWEQLGEME